jgi:mRNA interferase RelE/StbE
VRYRIEYTRAAEREITKLPRDLQKRIVARIESLGENPRPAGAVKLSGHEAYRTRVGDYRIIYAIADEKLVVLVIEVGHRREVYRRW